MKDYFRMMDFGNNMEISVAKHLIVSLFWILDAHPYWIRAFYLYKIKTNKIIVEEKKIQIWDHWKFKNGYWLFI